MFGDPHKPLRDDVRLLGELLGDTLRAMYAGWPFFRSTLDLIEMVLAKADARIAAEYDRRLVPPDLPVDRHAQPVRRSNQRRAD